MSRAAPRVSCVIVTHNFEPFVVRAIDSVLDQDYPRAALEILVVDDGSTDRTRKRLAPYLPNIRYIRTENQGVVSAYSLGIQEARGEFIALQDGDDVSLPDRIRRQVSSLQARHEVGLVYGDMAIIDAQDRLIASSYFTEFHITPLRGRPLGPLLVGNCVSGGASMLRAELKSKFLPIPQQVAAWDWWIAIQVAQVAELEYLEHVVLHYRRHGGNRNLGRVGADRLALLAAMPGFRRWLFSHLDLEQVAIEDLLKAWACFEQESCQVAHGRRQSLIELLGREDRLRGQATELARAGLAALSDGRAAAAVRPLIRALALDPWLGRARAGLQAALERLGKTAAKLPAGKAGLSRPILMVGAAAELASNSDLLWAYAKRFGHRDDVALLACHAEQLDDSGQQRLVRNAASACLEIGPDQAFGLLSGQPDDEITAQLAERALAGLTEGPPAWGPAGPWTFGLEQIEDLCDFVVAYCALSEEPLGPAEGLEV